MFNLRVPPSLAELPGRIHECVDDGIDAQNCTTKVCKCCGVAKVESEYSVRKEGYLRSYCKPCMVAKSLAWIAANRERVNAWKRQWLVKNGERINARRRKT